MGIHGLLKELGPGERISLAKFSSDHYVAHARPFRLAIDISIWLFQIQSGKGGSNPALRTFYYRLLRLLTLNIHPLFVFDGPNKPVFKRNRKVGGPGVRVASVPEFLAKQLLKQLGFPWHVAPGEAEAECALLQREGVVDAVLSEDVDTLMFGAGVWLRNWTSENASKTPTHTNVYRAAETKESSRGLDRDGMILVALMSGGDYLPEGIPGCGPKVACDAARAGYGKELCALGRKDATSLKLWKERLQHQIRTNEAKHFSRKNRGFTMPEDFPNLEVLGYYTHPCVSTPDKVQKLRETVRWDQEIDFAKLRVFTSEAFDWRCLGGAKKFIKNLAPAMLVRELRLRAETEPADSHPDSPDVVPKELVGAIHGKRNHNVVDGELEYRISFTPTSLVPIDLGVEEDDDEVVPGGGEDTETELEFAMQPASAVDENGSDPPLSPSKKRQLRPYDPTQPEKLWLLRTFLQIGCPLLVEEYEASFRDPKEFLKMRRKARAAASGADKSRPAKPTRSKKTKEKTGNKPENTLMSYGKMTKSTSADLKRREPLKGSMSLGNELASATEPTVDDEGPTKKPGFRLPAGEPLLARCSRPTEKQGQPRGPIVTADIEIVDLQDDDAHRPCAQPVWEDVTIPVANPACQPHLSVRNQRERELQKTPTRRKRRSPDLSSPALSQRTIMSYYSPSPRKPVAKHFKSDEVQASATVECVDLASNPSARSGNEERGEEMKRGLTPTRSSIRHRSVQSTDPPSYDLLPLPDTVTKRRRRGPLRRHQTAPILGADENDLVSSTPSTQSFVTPAESCIGGDAKEISVIEAMDLESPFSGARTGRFPLDNEDNEDDLPSPSILVGRPAPSAKPLRSSSYLMPSVDERRLESESLPPWLPLAAAPMKANRSTSATAGTTSEPALLGQPQANCHSRHSKQAKGKRALILRESLEGAWKEAEIDSVDLSGDGSGWAMKSNSRRQIWRKSGVEVVDLTGAL